MMALPMARAIRSYYTGIKAGRYLFYPDYSFPYKIGGTEQSRTVKSRFVWSLSAVRSNRTEDIRPV